MALNERASVRSGVTPLPSAVYVADDAIRFPGDGNDFTCDQDTIVVGADTTTSTATVNVPASEEEEGRVIIVTDVGGNALNNNITFSPNGNIDGSATTAISADNGEIRAICDGTNWFTI